MNQQIEPQRLKQVRKARGLTQEELARKAKLNKQTVYRLETAVGSVRQANLEKLARSLDVAPEVLTGEAQLPEMNLPALSAEEAAYQLNVRVDAAVRNSFELVARQYRVSVAKVAQLAPLCFVMLAEASLRDRRRKLTEYEEALGRVGDLGAGFARLPTLANPYEQEQAVEAERESIAHNDLFAEDVTDPWIDADTADDENPFERFLKALAARTGEVTVTAVGPAETDYTVCRSTAMGLVGGDEEVADWLLSGEVPIHRIPKGLKSVNDRKDWMRENRIAVRKVDETVPEAYPGDLDFDYLAIDLDDLL
jgi:transcriptional regulator with XRE-family HTH domain